MTMITLADLAAVATTGKARSAGATFHSVSVEEARVFVKVKNGDKKQAEDGSQNLTLVLGKHTLPLDAIKPGATRLAVVKDQVEAYTDALMQAVAEGLFDPGIIKAQALAKAQYEKCLANPRTRAPKAVEAAATEGLDLDALEVGEVAEVVSDVEL